MNSTQAFLIESSSVKITPSKENPAIFGTQDLGISMENLPFMPVGCQVMIKSRSSEWRVLPSAISGGSCKMVLPKVEQNALTWQFRIRITDNSGKIHGINLDHALQSGAMATLSGSAILIK